MAGRADGGERYDDEDRPKLKLMNNTLQTENDFLREELHNLQRKILAVDQRRGGSGEGNGYRRLEGRYVEGESGKKKYLVMSPAPNDDRRFSRLEEESRKVWEDYSPSQRRSTTPNKRSLTPSIRNSGEDQEIDILRTEVKRLREVIEKLSKVAKDKQTTSSPGKSGTSNAYEAYYDRSPMTIESMRMELEK
jgi:regulator of replication initiation timing